MIKTADVSIGIKSSYSMDIVNQASLWHENWKPVVDLLLVDGPQKATMYVASYIR